MALINPRIIDLLWIERKRQLDLFGAQDHPYEVWQTILTEEVGELAEAILEEKFEGASAANIRKEAIEVAAVAIAIVEAVGVPPRETFDEEEKCPDPNSR